MSSHSDERYMVARILVDTSTYIVTRTDDPKQFKDNAKPYVFSQARYDKIVEDLKAIAEQDPSTVQALVRDAPSLRKFAYLILDRKGKSFGRRRRLSIPSMQRIYIPEVIRSFKGDADPEAARILATLEAACWRIWKRPSSRESTFRGEI
jgi:hypothetical protein